MLGGLVKEKHTCMTLSVPKHEMLCMKIYLLSLYCQFYFAKPAARTLKHSFMLILNLSLYVNYYEMIQKKNEYNISTFFFRVTIHYQ